MTDLSPEATVAAEAAAAAVEELHDREEVAEAAVAAAIESEGARELAGEAAMAAGEALGTAYEASNAVAAAAESAAIANETAVESIDFARAAHEEATSARRELQEFKTELFALLSAEQSEENAESGVQEVEVHDNAAAQEEGRESVQEDSGESGGGDGGGNQRFGRRVRRGRR